VFDPEHLSTTTHLKSPAAKRVAEYDKANPGTSTRQAAADLGISNKTVSKARSADVTQVTPEIVTGRDGKTYPARRQKENAADSEPEFTQEQYRAAYMIRADQEAAGACVVQRRRSRQTKQANRQRSRRRS
jgi:hypothetical protein